MTYPEIKEGDIMVILENTKVIAGDGQIHIAKSAYSVTATKDSSPTCEWAFWRGGMAKKLNLFLKGS